MLIDFHTHSSASDGALMPCDIVARALTRNIDMLAITDHDTTAGYQVAAAQYKPKPGGMQLLSGIEFSCVWSGTTIHILGLGFDCDHPVMRHGVTTMTAARAERAQKIAERLASRGFAGALEGAMAQAGESQLGRPHFAAWMVEQGHVSEVNDAFKRYLGQGKIGDVKTFWPALSEVTGWITAAGGVALIAHPLKYRYTGLKLRRLITDFRAAGGAGLEILSGRQTADQTAQLLRLAEHFEMEISVGSDFHRDHTYGAPLGVELRQFEGSRGVWDRWSVP